MAMQSHENNFNAVALAGAAAERNSVKCEWISRQSAGLKEGRAQGRAEMSPRWAREKEEEQEETGLWLQPERSWASASHLT